VWCGPDCSSNVSTDCGLAQGRWRLAHRTRGSFRACYRLVPWARIYPLHQLIGALRGRKVRRVPIVRLPAGSACQVMVDNLITAMQ
jgi:hypothetical protein